MRNRFYIGLLGFERLDGKTYFGRSIFSNFSAFCYNLSFDLFARERTDYSCFGESETPLSQMVGVKAFVFLASGAGLYVARAQATLSRFGAGVGAERWRRTRLRHSASQLVSIKQLKPNS